MIPHDSSFARCQLEVPSAIIEIYKTQTTLDLKVNSIRYTHTYKHDPSCVVNGLKTD